MAKTKIPFAQRMILNELFKKIAALFGYNDAFSFNFADQIDAPERGVDLSTIYVDGTNGLDTNPGSSNLPLKTIQAAINLAPDPILSNVTIDVAPGTYTESLTIFNKIRIKDALFTIRCSTFTDFTPSAGPATGTIATADATSRTTGNVLTVTGATWTPSALKGYFVQLTSGASSGEMSPIFDNTADTIIICGEGRNETAAFSTKWANQTFKFVSPGAILNQVTDPTVLCGSTSDGLSIAGATSGDTAMPTYGVMFSGFRINGAASKSTLRLVGAGHLGLYRCYISMGTSGQSYGYGACRYAFHSCYVTGGNSSAFVGGGNNGRLDVENCVFDSVRASYIGSNGISGFKRSIVRNAGGVALWPGRNTAIYLNACRVLGSTQGVYNQLASQWGENAGANILLYYSDITGCTKGIEIAGSHATIALTSTSSVSNNSTWGIIVGDGTRHEAAFNNIMIDNTCIMGSNTSGDFTLDGTTALALADVTGDADKMITDAARFNRVASN